MKRIISISIILIISTSYLAAQGLLIPKGTFSVLGEKRDSVLSTYASTDAVKHSDVAEKAGSELVDFIEQRGALYFSKDRWLKMRDRMERGLEPGEREVVVSTSARPAVKPAPLPPGLAVELPYESQLSISGRKTIGVSLNMTHYDAKKDNRRKTDTSFNMEQQLQVRIKGRVGRKINVNVDFDDTTADKRDISVIYKGDSDEVVQEAAFGDITMSLPSKLAGTYSKPLFGVKLVTKYKGWKSWNYFSRTKGKSAVEKITGRTKFRKATIQDINYRDLRHYVIRFNNDIIKVGSAKVYRDNHVNTSTNTADWITITKIEDAVTTSTEPYTYTGDFDLLVPGQDYNIDYSAGVVSFRNRLGSGDVIAVNYQRRDVGETWLAGSKDASPIVIKDEQSKQAGITRELKSYYDLGNVQVIRDNGRGNFILQVKEGTDVSSNITDMDGNILHATPAYYKEIDDTEIVVDFESGIFYFKYFSGEPPNWNPFHDELYTAERKHKYDIYAEFHYLIKENIKLKNIGIIPQSERVTMDGKLLVRDADYFIDYDIGLINLYNWDKITESTVIEVSYDYNPFGTAGGSTIMGTRSELSLTPNIYIGGSYLYDFAAKTLSIPEVRTTPASLRVWETDMKFSNIKVPLTPLTFTVSGEYAESKSNPNVMDKAIIESMEGIKQEDTVSLYHESWQPASNPSGERFFRQDITVREENNEVDMYDITNDPIYKDKNEKRQVLSIDYNLVRSSEVSIVQSISTVGIDYSDKLYLEMLINGDGNGEELLISYGSFNEDADGDSILDSEDANNNGVRDEGEEDDGWNFTNPDSEDSNINIKGKIDSEDLDRDGKLDAEDQPASPCPFDTFVDAQGISYSAVTWTGWKYFKMPLEMANPNDWKAIKQVRITVKGNSASLGESGGIQIANLSLISNKWEPDGTYTEISTFTISGINNEDNPQEYSSLVYNEQYRSLYMLEDDTNLSSKREQALSLKYELISSTAVLAAKAQFGTSDKPYDLSLYKHFRFFIYHNEAAAGDTFFIRAGDDKNYYEYSIELSTNQINRWNLIEIAQAPLDDDKLPVEWFSMDNGTTRKVGSPQFQKISQMKLGVHALDPSRTGEREIWVNEIHVKGSRARSGMARHMQGDLKWPGFISLGGSRKETGRSFQNFSAGVYNRDSLDDSAYFNIDRFRLIPIASVQTKLNHSYTVTPIAQSDLQSVQEEGKVISYSGSTSVSPNLGSIFLLKLPIIKRFVPSISGNASGSITDTRKIEKLEDRWTLGGSSSWGFPVKFPIINVFPKNLSAGLSRTDSFFRVYPSSDIANNEDFEHKNDFLGMDMLSNGYIDQCFDSKGKLREDNYKTKEESEAWNASMPFEFWRGFNFTPSYNLNRAWEHNKALDGAFDKNPGYPKSASQSISASSNLKVFKWFTPNLSYKTNVTESFNSSFSTATAVKKYPSERKSIKRSVSADVSWNFQFKDFWVRLPFTKSLGFNASYRIQDNDFYDNIESSFPVIISSLDSLLDEDLNADEDMLSRILWVRDNRLIPLNLGTTTYYYGLKTLNSKDDMRLSGRWNPLESIKFPWRLSPFQTLSITNFTYTDSKENSYNTGTIKEVSSITCPDWTITFRKWEELFWLERWVGNSRLTLRHKRKISKTIDVSRGEDISYGTDLSFRLIKKLDLNFGFSLSNNENYNIAEDLLKTGRNISLSGGTSFNYKAWRFSVKYGHSDDNQTDQKDYSDKSSSNDSITLQANSDLSFPHGMPLPFSNKKLNLKNRLTFGSTLKFDYKDADYDIDRNRINNYNLSANADYEISQNFRSTLGFGYSYLQNRENNKENRHSMNLSFKMTIVF